MTDLTDAPAGPGPAAHPPSADAAHPALPVVDDPEAPVVRPKEVRRQARRRFLQMMGAAGVGVGLAFTDSLSTRFARPASAAPYEMWRDCRGYFSSSTVCVPSSAYYGADNCDANAWHRDDGFIWPLDNGLWMVFDFIHIQACSGHNAWLWFWADGTSTKCSDGRYETWLVDPATGGGTRMSSQFSICRNTGWF